jgi:hypothetical protein
MKRSKALASLSRDHHRALVVAQKLRRATDATAREARDAFLAYWTGHGRQHFRLEEELLFPAYAGYGDPHDPLVLRALGQHVMIRHRAAALAHVGTALPASLEQLGAAGRSRPSRGAEVFPLIERVMPTHELEAVARELESAKHA